jgi:cell division septum initiation protein DivIVA
MNEKPVKRYHMTHDRDFQRILAEVSGQEFLKFAQYVRSEDYDALKAENERLKAENERLREALAESTARKISMFNKQNPR